MRVNAISPGWTETELVAEYLATQPPDMRQHVLDVIPSGADRQAGRDCQLCRLPAFR